MCGASEAPLQWPGRPARAAHAGRAARAARATHAGPHPAPGHVRRAWRVRRALPRDSRSWASGRAWAAAPSMEIHPIRKMRGLLVSVRSVGSCASSAGCCSGIARGRQTNQVENCTIQCLACFGPPWAAPAARTLPDNYRPKRRFGDPIHAQNSFCELTHFFGQRQMWHSTTNVALAMGAGFSIFVCLPDGPPMAGAQGGCPG